MELTNELWQQMSPKIRCFSRATAAAVLSALPAEQGALTDEQINVLSEVYDDAVLEKWPSKRLISHLRMCPCFSRRPSPAQEPVSPASVHEMFEALPADMKAAAQPWIDERRRISELKACLFCGYDDSFVRWNGTANSLRGGVCPKCKAMGPLARTNEKATANWNQRVPDEALVQALKLVRRCCFDGSGLCSRCRTEIDAALRSAGVEP